MDTLGVLLRRAGGWAVRSKGLGHAFAAREYQQDLKG